MNTLKTTMFMAAITVLFVLIGQTLGGMMDGACLCLGAERGCLLVQRLV